jgi:uncharacterized protein YjgD (DUF1641 family)
MNNEALIMERLDRIEAQLAPMAQSFKGISEFKDDMTPLANSMVKLLIEELEDVQSSFQLEDLMDMFKQWLRSISYITYSLRQLQNIVDFVTTLEPLLKSSVPQLINYLDDLEQRGVFRVVKAMLDIRAKVASAYKPEDIDEIGDGLVALLSLTKKVSHPQTMALLEKLAEVPSQVDLESAKGVGPIGFLKASSGKEAKEGLGVLLELTKAMGRIKA